MKYLIASLVCLIICIFAVTGFTKELIRAIDPIQVIAPDGSHYNIAVTAVVKKMTNQSYIMDLYDVDGKLLAGDRRFLIQSPVDLETDEIAYLRGAQPDETWSEGMIKKYLEDKAMVGKDGNKITPYKKDVTKTELLEIANPVREEEIK